MTATRTRTTPNAEQLNDLAWHGLLAEPDEVWTNPGTEVVLMPLRDGDERRLRTYAVSNDTNDTNQTN